MFGTDNEIDLALAALTNPNSPGGTMVSRSELVNLLTLIKSQRSLEDIEGTPGTFKIPKMHADGTVHWEPDLTGAFVDGVSEEGIRFDDTLVRPTVNGSAVSKRWIQFDNLIKEDHITTQQRVKFNVWHTATLQGVGDSVYPAGRINEVVHIGWNINAGGGEEIAGLGAIAWSIESNFIDRGEKLMELHEFFVDPITHKQFRLSSYTCLTDSLTIDKYFTVSNFYLKRPDRTKDQGQEGHYFSVGYSNTTGAISFGPDINNGYGSGIRRVTMEYTNGPEGGFAISQAGLTRKEFFLYGFEKFSGVAINEVHAESAVPGVMDTLVTIKGNGQVGMVPETHNTMFLGVFDRRLKQIYVKNIGIESKVSTPSTSDILNNHYAVYENSTDSSLGIYVNHNGTMKKANITFVNV